MTDVVQLRNSGLTSEKVANRVRKRYAAERRFRLYGLIAVCISLAFLALMLVSIVSKGYTAFEQAMVHIEVQLDEAVIDPEGTRNPDDLARADYAVLIRRSIAELFPDVSGRRDKRAVRKLLSPGAVYDVRELVRDDPGIIGQTITVWVPSSDDVDQLLKGNISRDVPESDRRISDKELGWIDALIERDLIDMQFNTRFFTRGASQEPELAGILGAAMGSFFALLITFLVSFPLGVMTATYLEEFAPKNRWTSLIEVNINNLAAVPSIVFGLLGLAVFLNFFGMPRSAPVVGGLVLALMTLPTIIITARAQPM
jgi:phosphate transport system permease protein